jgi:membrane dipeptidase
MPRVRSPKRSPTARPRGSARSGERPDTYPFVVDLRGPGQFHDLADRLRKRGYREARIEKILGLNFVNYAKTIWGA